MRSEWQRSAAYVDGAWLPVAAAVPVEDPYVGAPIGTAADGGPAEVDAAVAAAAAAFPAWSATTRSARAELLDRLLVELVARRDLLVETVVAEVGAPVTVAREAHVDLAVEILQGYVDLIRTPEPEERVGHSLLVRTPVGVVAAITPWNYPLYQLIAKIAPALAAGCTIVAKPAELTPLSAYVLWDAAAAAGFPAGVLNLVPGTGAGVGRALVDHPDVDLVSFTGSTAVGRDIAARAGARLARVSLELGGKSASVVAASVTDIGPAVRATVESAAYNAGQTCSALTRLIVPADRYDEAVALAAGAADGLVVGDPREESTEVGPLVSASQAERVHGYLDRARAGGADLHQAPAPDGAFVGVTIVSGVAPDTEIAQQEVFGPVLVVLPAASDDDAVAIATGTPYGLAGAVWAATTDEGVALARRMRTGQVDVNGAPFNPLAPFGGHRQSGIGRELGVQGMEEFTEITAIQVPTLDR